MFDPTGEWLHTYRIEAAGEEAIGLLRLERVRIRDQQFALKIYRRVVDDEGRAHQIDAVADCNTDSIASLRSWKLASRFYNLSGELIPVLTQTEAGEVEAADKPLAADWCLLEALQRMSMGGPPPPAFTLFEGLSVRRGLHRLYYDGLDAGLHRFHRIGPGSQPWEYRVDETFRLVRASTVATAHVLDEEAELSVAVRLQRIYQRKLRGEEDAG